MYTGGSMAKTKRTVNRVKINISLHPKVKEMLDDLAKQLNTTRTGVITSAVHALNVYRNPKLKEAFINMVLNFTRTNLK
jgi:type IV secretory pathway TraG/TraD family ATPase VirD4